MPDMLPILFYTREAPAGRLTGCGAGLFAGKLLAQRPSLGIGSTISPLGKRTKKEKNEGRDAVTREKR